MAQNWKQLFMRSMSALLQAQDPHVPGYMHSSQGEWLMRWAQMLPPDSKVVEIGALFGKSTRWLAAGCILSGSKLTSVDPWQGKAGGDGTDRFAPMEQMVQRNMFNIWQTVMNQSLLGDPELWRGITPVRGTSEDAAAVFKDGDIDLLYLDGDHTRALDDVQLYIPLMSEAGLMVLDDVTEDSSGLYGANNPGVAARWLIDKGWLLIGTMANGYAFTRSVDFWNERLAAWRAEFPDDHDFSWQHVIRKQKKAEDNG